MFQGPVEIDKRSLPPLRERHLHLPVQHRHLMPHALEFLPEGIRLKDSAVIGMQRQGYDGYFHENNALLSLDRFNLRYLTNRRAAEGRITNPDMYP